MATLTQAQLTALIQSLNVAVVSSDTSKYRLAKAFAEAETTVTWGATQYGSFEEMVVKELTISIVTVMQLIYNYRGIKLLQFTQAQNLIVLGELGWKRFTLASRKHRATINYVDFIKKYKGIALYKLSKVKKSHAKADRAYGFSLPCAYADKLDGILQQYGLTTVGTRRHNVRESVMRWLDTQ